MTENEFDRIEHIIDYNLAKQQIDEMQTITFGAEISVLLLTDRLYGCAKGLQEYMQNSTDITVDLADTLAGAKKLIAQKPIDFLIIVGYLENEEMYQATQELTAANEYSTVIMYAGLDCLIDIHCRRHGIAFKYHRREPIEGFVSYMRERYADAKETARLHRAFLEEKKRNQARIDRIQEIERLQQNERKKQRRKKILVYCAIAVLALVVLGFIFLLLG